MGVVGTELEALEAVEEKGGQTNAQSVAKKLKMNVDYVRTVLTGLARRDFLDLSKKGIYWLTPKGKADIDRRRKLSSLS
ncbi:hypothetical protein MYX84_04075 [Acidobacteria bacterium AH-259-O06]|nr:hypothetical protein [Acidobacteria bacterium AH-259-O06]